MQEALKSLGTRIVRVDAKSKINEDFEVEVVYVDLREACNAFPAKCWECIDKAANLLQELPR